MCRKSKEELSSELSPSPTGWMTVKDVPEKRTLGVVVGQVFNQPILLLVVLLWVEGPNELCNHPLSQLEPFVETE